MTLAPKGNAPVYHGQVVTPPLSRVQISSTDSLSPLRLLELEVVAYDGEKASARVNLDVQILDDPVEFHNPQPDIKFLEDLARASGGKVLHTADELAQLLDSSAKAPGEIVVHHTPVWDHPALWLVLPALLATEWTVRRRRGLA